jgi:hypothetical protein
MSLPHVPQGVKINNITNIKTNAPIIAFGDIGGDLDVLITCLKRLCSSYNSKTRGKLY